MSFLPVGASPSVSYHQPIAFDLDDMRQKAISYADGDEELLDYINTILQKDAFQSNPKVYLDAWKKERGFTEEFRMPEDQAHLFFNRHCKF